jgi:hypothetical protein
MKVKTYPPFRLEALGSRENLLKRVFCNGRLLRDDPFSEIGGERPYKKSDD